MGENETKMDPATGNTGDSYSGSNASNDTNASRADMKYSKLL
jgi:hypothetical protein